MTLFLAHVRLILRNILKPVNQFENVLLEYSALNYGLDSKLHGDSKIDPLLYTFEVEQVSTRNSWGLNNSKRPGSSLPSWHLPAQS